MKKIPTYFDRDWEGDRSRVVDRVNPACEWVAAGEGVATRKIDGACCMIRAGRLYKRREVKYEALVNQSDADFEVVDTDTTTRKAVGWAPVGDGPEDQWFREALREARALGQGQDGTYELCGPKVQGNPENYARHTLVRHDRLKLPYSDGAPPRDFEGLRAWMDGREIEGIVWHHQDGRMAKLKLRDFGLRRPSRT